MPNYINVHCHLQNYEFIPDSYFKVRAPLREWMLRWRLTKWLVFVVTALWPGISYDRFHEVLDMFKKDIIEVTEDLITEMKDAGIAIATPIMLDLEMGSFNEKAEFPYRYQVMLMSEVAAKYPGVLLPFIMVDPRRASVYELMVDSLEKMGIYGVKLYPALGYHPDPSSFYNDAHVNQALHQIYKYCETHNIPITSHCSPGGSYSSDFIHCRMLIPKYSHPQAWAKVLEQYPKLTLNIAHFGGDIMKINEADNWQQPIIELMKTYTNVFSDIAYHAEAFNLETQKTYFKILGDLLDAPITKDRTLFGTDWPTTRHTWRECDYIKPFMDNLSTEQMELLCHKNPSRFLFPEKQLPKRIQDFYSSAGVTTSNSSVEIFA